MNKFCFGIKYTSGSNEILSSNRYRSALVTLVAILTIVTASERYVFCREIPAQVLSSSELFTADEYPIGINDVIEISVYEEPDMRQVVQVSAKGYITYPLLGRIKAAGLSVADLEDAIAKALSKDYIRNPQVKVQVQEFSNVYVMGSVNSPGPLKFASGMTLVQAVTLAGGFLSAANQRKVHITRLDKGNRKREIINANVKDITNGKKDDILVQSGDTIVVPDSFF